MVLFKKVKMYTKSVLFFHKIGLRESKYIVLKLQKKS